MLVLGGAAGSVALVEIENQRLPVTVLTRDAPAGHVLGAEDLRIVELSGAEGLGLVRADGDGAVGRRLAVPIRAGTPLSEAALAEEAGWPQEGRAVVSVALPVGDVPSSAVPGARVAAVLTGAGGDAVVARVHSRTGAETVDEVAVELEVPAEHMARVARAAADQELRLALVWPDGEGTGGAPEGET